MSDDETEGINKYKLLLRLFKHNISIKFAKNVIILFERLYIQIVNNKDFKRYFVDTNDALDIITGELALDNDQKQFVIYLIDYVNNINNNNNNNIKRDKNLLQLN